MAQKLYSIRMHASLCGTHLSGAERIGTRQEAQRLAASLVGRALDHSRGEADRINLTVETLDPADIRKGKLPDLTTVVVTDFMQGRRAAKAHLREARVSGEAADKALRLLARGPAPDGGSMRGAMLVDAQSGERLEPDPHRGVRARGMDLTPEAAGRLRKALAARGLDNFHVREALVLAAKVLSAPGIMAELCWSDDPGYTAGYVASPELGYVRFPYMKPQGQEGGGRAFFFRPGTDPDEVIDHLERSVLLIDEIGALRPDRTWEG